VRELKHKEVKKIIPWNWGTVLNEMIQAQKDKYCMLLLMEVKKLVSRKQ
jgi:hypothetical protein